MIRLYQVSKEEEIYQIKSLQEANLKSQLKKEERESQGFLTASYSVDFLKKMNQLHPAIIAKDGDTLAGYALVSSPAIKGEHALLDDLIGHCDEVVYKTQKLSHLPYAIVGQLCVAKHYRGRGLVKQLYQHFRACNEEEFRCCITDVDTENRPSLRAHLNSGFEVVGRLGYGGAQWNLVLWNWNL